MLYTSFLAKPLIGPTLEHKVSGIVASSNHTLFILLFLKVVSSVSLELTGACYSQQMTVIFGQVPVCSSLAGFFLDISRMDDLTCGFAQYSPSLHLLFQHDY